MFASSFIDLDIVGKFQRDVKKANDTESIIYTRKINCKGLDISDAEEYYKVVTIDAMGVVRVYLSLDLDNPKWFQCR